MHMLAMGTDSSCHGLGWTSRKRAQLHRWNLDEFCVGRAAYLDVSVAGGGVLNDGMYLVVLGSSSMGGILTVSAFKLLIVRLR